MKVQNTKDQSVSLPSACWGLRKTATGPHLAIGRLRQRRFTASQDSLPQRGLNKTCSYALNSKFGTCFPSKMNVLGFNPPRVNCRTRKRCRTCKLFIIILKSESGIQSIARSSQKVGFSRQGFDLLSQQNSKHEIQKEK